MRWHQIWGVVFLVTVASTAGVQAQQNAPQTVEGTLNIVWGDPHPELGSGGETLYTLESLDERVIPPQLVGQKRVLLRLNGQENVATYYFGKRAVVSGPIIPNPSVTARTPEPVVMVVGSITPSQAPQGQVATAAVIGTRKVIYLLLKFSDDTAVPHPPSFYTNLNNPDTPPGGEVFPATINGFFKKTSWNQFSWLGDVGGVGGIGAPGGWLTLPHPKSYYADCNFSTSCANLRPLADDGTALGRAEGISFTNYDNINFVLSNDLDCCAWGGGYFSSVDNKVYGATWEPPWGQEAGTYAHEMGHSIGLPHSGWVYYAYDSPWDMMSARLSANSVVCGSYVSKNTGGVRNLICTEPGDGFIAPHKDYLGWIPSVNIVATTAGSSVTVTLEANALPLSSETKMIKICITGFSCSGSAARYLTVEARVKGLGTTSQYDNAIPGEGVIIHEFQGDRPPIGGACFFNSQSGWALPVDSTPNDYDSVNCNPGGRFLPNYALFNAQWSPGQAYTNSTYGLVITVVSRTGSTFVVAISTTSTSTGAIRNLPGFAANTLPANDDLSTGPVSLGFTINFFSSTYDSLFINNNGNFTFNASLSTFSPSALSSLGVPIIAPFFADVDTRAVGENINQVTYGTDVVDGRPAFGATWFRVGYFSQKTNRLNSFQAIIIKRSDVSEGAFDIEFNYDQIQWDAGEASGGVEGLCPTGTGGTTCFPARVGYSNGSGQSGTFFELPGSGQAGAFLDTNPSTGLICGSANSTQPGRYVFEIRQSGGQLVQIQNHCQKKRRGQLISE